MQPRAEEISRVLTAFAQAARGAEGEGRRRTFSLVVQGSTPLMAEFRELRGRCAMIDIGSSIFTLSYHDILGLDPVSAADGGLRVTVRPGCFASHAAARLRRNAGGWRAVTPESTPRVVERQRRLGAEGPAAQQTAAPATDFEEFLKAEEREGGIAEGDPAWTVGAGQEVAGADAARRRG